MVLVPKKRRIFVVSGCVQIVISGLTGGMWPKRAPSVSAVQCRFVAEFPERCNRRSRCHFCTAALVIVRHLVCRDQPASKRL